MRIRSAIWSVGVTVAISFLAEPAFAGSINLDTGSTVLAGLDQNWAVQRLSPTGSVSAPQQAAVVTSLPSPWLSASEVGDGTANWISWTANQASYSGDQPGTTYLFENSFYLDPLVKGQTTLDLKGSIASDNFIGNATDPGSGITLYYLNGSTPVYVPVSVTPSTYTNPGQTYKYTISADVSSFLFNSPQRFYFDIAVVNGFSYSSANDPGAIGLVFQGDASTPSNISNTPQAVPLPSSAKSGLALLAGLGMLTGLRMLVTGKPQI